MRQCSECGTNIDKRRYNVVVCGGRCSSVRSRRLGAQAHRLAIFERGEWTCGICGDSIDPDLPGTDPNGATMDHIVPVSAGGMDDDDNLQPAHRRCNEAKGARIPWWAV